MRNIRVLFLASATTVYLLLAPSPLIGIMLLDDVMSRADQQKTGVSTLNRKQKAALEAWLNDNFERKVKTVAPAPVVLTLTENINNGAQLKLSDGSIYEIAPGDRRHSELWITPFTILVEASGDPTYPCLLTNQTTKVSVKARLLP